MCCCFTADTPYAVWQHTDLNSLIRTHSKYQHQALASDNTSPAPSAILVTPYEGLGIGNRLPSIATAYVIALFTTRVLLVDSKTVMGHITLPFPADWHHHMDRYSQHHVNCTWPGAHVGQMLPCGQNYSYGLDSTSASNITPPSWREAVLLKYRSNDYQIPLLQINRQMGHLFTRFFPDGEVFHAVAKHIFQPSLVVTKAMQPYLERAADCAVGLHMRHRKPIEGSSVRTDQFASIALMLAKSKAGTMFLASDVDMFVHMQHLLGPQLWWNNLTRTSVNRTHTRGGNPGTEISAFVDLFLLSKCKAIVVSPASSFGQIAASLAGIRAVYATFGNHEAPFFNTWFWQSVTSEPCMYMAGKINHFGGNMRERLKADYPLYLYQTQCHF